MSIRPPHSPPGVPGAASGDQVCPHCGGSGTLRLDECRYRTCLECLGSGRSNAAAAALRVIPEFSAWTPSSSAAR